MDVQKLEGIMLLFRQVAHLKTTQWALTIEVKSVLVCHIKVLTVSSRYVSFDQTDWPHSDVIALHRVRFGFPRALAWSVGSRQVEVQPAQVQVLFQRNK